MRSVSLPTPGTLRIVTDRVAYDYRIEVWHGGNGVHRIVNLYRTDGQAAYQITVGKHTNPRNATWRCDCPASQHRGGQCKHVLALKAGLRSVGCKV